MEPIAQIGDCITLPNCETTGTVENIKDVSGDAIGQDSMSVYEIATNEGRMRIPADWLARLISPA